MTTNPNVNPNEKKVSRHFADTLPELQNIIRTQSFDLMSEVLKDFDSPVNFSDKENPGKMGKAMEQKTLDVIGLLRMQEGARLY